MNVNVKVFSTYLVLLLALVEGRAQDTLRDYLNGQLQSVSEASAKYRRTLVQMDSIYIGQLHTLDGGHKVLDYCTLIDNKKTSHGPFTWYWRNGNLRAKGAYEKGHYSGIISTYNREGRLLREAEYLNGVTHGIDKGYQENGKLAYQGIRADGYFEGPLEFYYDKGQIQKKLHVTEGIADSFTKYYPDGNVKKEGAFESYAKTGTWKWFWEGGSTFVQATFARGHTLGKVEAWYPSGKQMYVAEHYEVDTSQAFIGWQQDTLWNEDLLNALSGRVKQRTAWFENGALRMQEQYTRNGKRTGKWIRYHAEGKLAHQGEFKNGLPISELKWFDEQGELIKTVKLQESDQASFVDEAYNEKALQMIRKNLRYPKKAKDAGIQGTVYIEVFFNVDGYPVRSEVKKGVHPVLDAQAVMVAKHFPRIDLQQMNGEKGKYLTITPIRFSLR